MKDVSQYPIKYGFGVTSPAPWSPSHPHLGVDRPTPMRTPLKVNGQLVAYTGNTGGVAAHHHLQKVAGGKVVNPGDGGFVIPEPAVVFAVDNVNDTNIGKALRIRDGQGVEWSHFHLDEILVKTGDKIGEDDMPKEQDVKYYFSAYEGNTPTATDIKYFTTHPWRKLADRALLKQGDALKAQVVKLTAENIQLKADFKPLAPGKYLVK